jgi:hypothetical protein
MLSNIARGILAVAAAAVPYAGFSQPQGESFDETQRQFIETIAQEQRQNGPFSENLLEPLTALSLLYEENGEHALAAVAAQRALQVLRVNRGLRTFDQAPLIQVFIRNEEARGNVAAAWDLEQNLLALVKRHPDDVRAIPILREIGDRRMALLERYLGGQSPPEIALGCYYQFVDVEGGSCTSGNKHTVVQGILMDAWSSQLDAISVFLRHELYSSPELRELETQLLRSSFLYGNYGLGHASLRRLYGYDVANAAPPLTQLETLLQLADWDLLFGEIISAHEHYREAYELLEQQGTAAQASIERLFSPQQPIVLPTFLPSPLDVDAGDRDGFVVVAFDVTWHGNAKRVEILEANPEVTSEAKKRLVHLLSSTKFRPRIVAGDLPQSSRVVVRYDLSAQPDMRDDPRQEVLRRNIRHYRADVGLPRHFVEQLFSAQTVAAERD